MEGGNLEIFCTHHIIKYNSKYVKDIIIHTNNFFIFNLKPDMNQASSGNTVDIKSKFLFKNVTKEVDILLIAELLH